MSERHVVLPGKLPPDLLYEVLSRLAPRDPRVLVGPRCGEDAAVIDLGDRLLVAAADPITFAADGIGSYAVAVNANDVAVRGATPRWFLATVLMPEGTTADAVRAVMADLAAASAALGVDLVGGHTEITPSVVRPVVAGTMLGDVTREALVTTGGARPGDALVLGGMLAVEGTAVLAREASDLLLRGGIAPDAIDAARDLLRTPGISILGMAQALCAAVKPHAMHDPTEGGLATALAELATASGTGLRLDDAGGLPILPQTRSFCAALGLDPLGLLASGALLAALGPADAGRAVEALTSAGFPAAIIGSVCEAGEGLTMSTPYGPQPLPTFARDELARLLG